MKNVNKKIELKPLAVKELITIKGGLRKIPLSSIAPMARTNRWEDFEIRFGGHGGTKNGRPSIHSKLQKPG